MMTKKQSFIFTYLLMNTIMCICMATAALLVNVGFITLPMFLVTLLEALAICNICTLVLRIPTLSFKGAMALSKGNPGSKAFTIWNGLFNATLNTICMNTFMTLINVGFKPAYFPAWLHGFPVLEIVAIVVSFAVAPLAMKIAMKADKENMNPQEQETPHEKL